MHTLICEICNGKFKAKRNDAKTCGDRCRTAKSALKLVRSVRKSGPRALSTSR